LITDHKLLFLILWLDIFCKCSSVICDVISVYKHGCFKKTNEDKMLMKTLRLEKGWSELGMMQEFSS